MRGLMEPCISQQANGRLNMVMRTQLGSVFYSESYDDGRTWSKPQPTCLRAPESCPCTATIPGTDVQIIVWNNSEYDMHWRSHYGKRTPLTMALSRDGLRTFTDFIDLETDPMQIYTNPAITTMGLDKIAMGRQAMATLFQIMNGSNYDRISLLPTTLVERSSVKTMEGHL